jgi:inner membrane protein
MIVAHLPAGYLIARLWRRLRPASAGVPGLMAWGAVGGVIPDIDMFWSTMVDHGSIHHHRYITHWPLFWLCVFGLAAAVLAVRRARTGWQCLGVFALAVTSHLFLDWFVSPVWLLAPFLDQGFHLVTVPAAYRPWVLNFIFHWVGWIDIGIALLGAALFAHTRWPRSHVFGLGHIAASREGAE